MKTRKKSSSNLFLKVSVILITTILALFSCELVARIALTNTGSLDKRLIEPYLMTGHFYSDAFFHPQQPTQEYGYEEIGGQFIFRLKKKINSIADRGDFLFNGRQDLLNKKNRGDLFVFAIGASVVQGAGASSPDHYWYLHLEKMLSDKIAKRVHVIPVAIASYVSSQERIALELFAIQHCPDAILILDGWNDIAAGLTGSRPGDPYNMGIIYESFYHPFFWGLKKFFANSSVLYRHLLTQKYQRNIYDAQSRLLNNPSLLEDHIQSVLNVYRDNQIAMQSEAKSKEIPILTILQPAQILSVKHADPNHRSGNAVEDVFVQTYKKIIATIPDFKHQGIQIESLTDKFSDPAEFADPVHFHDKSQLKLAELLLNPVAELLRNSNKKCR